MTIDKLYPKVTKLVEHGARISYSVEGIGPLTKRQTQKRYPFVADCKKASEGDLSPAGEEMLLRVREVAITKKIETVSIGPWNIAIHFVSKCGNPYGYKGEDQSPSEVIYRVLEQPIATKILVLSA